MGWTIFRYSSYKDGYPGQMLGVRVYEVEGIITLEKVLGRGKKKKGIGFFLVTKCSMPGGEKKWFLYESTMITFALKIISNFGYFVEAY